MAVIVMKAEVVKELNTCIRTRVTSTNTSTSTRRVLANHTRSRSGVRCDGYNFEWKPHRDHIKERRATTVCGRVPTEDK